MKFVGMHGPHGMDTSWCASTDRVPRDGENLNIENRVGRSCCPQRERKTSSQIIDNSCHCRDTASNTAKRIVQKRRAERMASASVRASRVLPDDLVVVVPHRDGGSAYHWRSRISPFASALAGSDAVHIGWCASRGRCILAARAIKCGELVMQVPALGHVLFDDVRPNSRSCAYESDEFGLDEAAVALAIAVMQSEEQRCIVRALSADEADDGDVAVLKRVVHRIRAHSSALPPPIATLADDELARLCLRVKRNLHVSRDDETATRATGVGLYPAAALFNHSCSPSVCFAWSERGRCLQARAIVDVPAGAELCCSYLSDEQLYSPLAERATLLRAAFGFDLDQCPERCAAEHASVAEGSPSAALEREAHARIGAVRAALRVSKGAKGEHAADDTGTLGGAAKRLLHFLNTGLQGSVHPFHWLVMEAHAALLAAVRADGVDEPQAVAKTTLHLIAACEFHLPHGTPHLAALYSAHGGALCRVLRVGGLSANEHEQVCVAALRSLTAAHRIRKCCLGENHPLTRATAAAVERQRQRAYAVTPTPDAYRAHTGG